MVTKTHLVENLWTDNAKCGADIRRGGFSTNPAHVTCKRCVPPAKQPPSPMDELATARPELFCGYCGTLLNDRGECDADSSRGRDYDNEPPLPPNARQQQEDADAGWN